MAQIQVDQGAMLTVYKEKFATVTEENILLTVACNQLQQRIEELQAEVAKLTEHSHEPEKLDNKKR